jgi:hypothetical protein
MQQFHCNIGVVFSTQSVPICYKQEKLVNWDCERVSQSRESLETFGQLVGELVSK